MLHTSGKESKASPTASSSQEGEECTRKEREEVKQVLQAVSLKTLVAEQRKQVATPLEHCHGEALSSSEAATHNARPRVNLLNILRQGWDLRSVCSLGCCSGWLLLSSHSLCVFSSPSLSPPDCTNMKCTNAPTKEDERRWRPSLQKLCFDQFLGITLMYLYHCMKPRDQNAGSPLFFKPHHRLIHCL